MAGRARWQDYEEHIYRSLSTKVAPGASVTFDADGRQRLPGRFSGAQRQIDVIVRGTFAGLPGEHVMVVDCKCFSSTIDVGTVEAFAGLVEDVGVPLALMVTTIGFSEAAKKRALAVRGMLLDIVSMDELDQWALRGPTIAITSGSNHGSLTWWDGGELRSKIVDTEFAQRLWERMK